MVRVDYVNAEKPLWSSTSLKLFDIRETLLAQLFWVDFLSCLAILLRFKVIARQIAIRSRKSRTFPRSENSLPIHLALQPSSWMPWPWCYQWADQRAVASWSRRISSAERAVQDWSVSFLSEREREICFLKRDDSRLCFSVLLARWRTSWRKELGRNPVALTWKKNFLVYYQDRQMTDDNVNEKRYIKLIMRIALFTLP